MDKCMARKFSKIMHCYYCKAAWSIDGKKPLPCKKPEWCLVRQDGSKFECICGNRWYYRSLPQACRFQPNVSDDGSHYHRDKTGNLIKCWHQCKSLFTDWKFWTGTLISWPIEHALYDKVWPFTLISEFFGIH